MTSLPSILQPRSDAEILATYEVMRQLRPHLGREEYVSLIRRLMEQERYNLVALVEGDGVRAVAGYRYMEMLYCGRFLYVDDLITDEAARSRGFGRQLLSWLKDLARSQGCSELQLDSATRRAAAHRFYEREGMEKTCYHFAASV
jgi:GNAT superfamily N-acetyltransferase